jgi:hypothetical protein
LLVQYWNIYKKPCFFECFLCFSYLIITARRAIKAYARRLTTYSMTNWKHILSLVKSQFRTSNWLKFFIFELKQPGFRRVSIKTKPCYRHVTMTHWVDRNMSKATDIKLVIVCVDFI